MPPWPRIFRMRYFPNRPSSPSACGGERKSVRLVSASGVPASDDPVFVALLAGGEGGASPVCAAVSCRGSPGDPEPEAAARSAPGGAAAGVTATWAQAGHLTFRPASARLIESFLRQAGHWKANVAAAGPAAAFGRAASRRRI